MVDVQIQKKEVNKLDELISYISEAFSNKHLQKITIGNLKEKKSYLKNVFIKPILIKEKPVLSFVYRYVDKDVTKNFSLDESIETIKLLLEKFFNNSEVYCSAKTIYYTQDNNGKTKLVIKQLDNPIEIKVGLHDKQKNRLISSNNLYLKELGVCSSDGKIKADMQHKFRQINKYVEIIDGILKDVQIKEDFKVLDMGSGKGYLTFALYDFLQAKKIPVTITGIELREELVIKCNAIAQKANFSSLHFEQGSIQNSNATKADMLIALHACDTATDDAIAKGIKSNATYIICAPCCHKQIRKQMAPTNALKNITKHGILLERQAEMVTDTIRALILEAYGYKTKVFDFIEEEDTPKNVLIVGTKQEFSDIDFKENMGKVTALKEIFGITTHYLETILN
jgi:SAM-dependent methyltransferase